MNCIIPGPNLKIFAKALQALAKIGDDLYVEASKEHVSLITLNLRKTVCVHFNLLDIFFSTYEVDITQIADKSQGVSCKIHMKTLLPLFRGTNLEKKLDYVKVEYDNNSDFIVFKMKYKYDDILMTHQLHLIEPELLTIDISPDSGCNNVVTTSTFFNQLLNMFSNSDDEILFEITKEKAVIRNYYVGAPVRSKSVRSQVSPNGSEFSVFRINLETTINFSLKPFRTAIQFAEGFNLNICLNFEQGGKPLCVTMKNPTFEMNFMIATINPYNENQSIATSSIPARITGVNNDIANVTADDREVLLNENWDDFSMETIGEGRIANKKSKKSFPFNELLDTTKENRRNSNDERSLNGSLKNSAEKALLNTLESNSRKKAKIVFGRCFESTFSRAQLGDVLVSDSDSE
ncbi:cell cycle checkpoint control protein RAD9A-like [Diorhabda sublineata]|uniref:cell cycle checkpoint control protein RAD9A-like n=1 Tax=Diorhabda sublineata TaxID=1163346 RepID=UPI0024E12E7F|nr:cell cycle checkpoint control protein RAD9A-like [Diorhabda sublineata]